MQLSKHFKLEEFEKSMTAARHGLENKAGSGEIKNLTDLCYTVLEPCRAKFDKPIIISSGFRSEKLCEILNSSKASQHTKGQAVDFEIIGVSNLQVAIWIENSGWIHCSYVEGSNRKQVLTFDGKKYSNGLPEMKWSGGKVIN